MRNMNDWQPEPPEYKPPADANIQPAPAPAPVAPPQAAEPPAPPTQEGGVQAEEFAGLPVRVAGDKIFLIKNGKKHWITSPDAFDKLGFRFGDEVMIDEASLAVFPEGTPIR